jgi:hypothetical protein
VPYRGPVEGTMSELMGGVRSAMTYIGAVRLKEIPKRTTFIMVGSQLNTVFGRDGQARRHSARKQGSLRWMPSASAGSSP